MSQLFAQTLDDQIAAVEREIALRERVYPMWVEQRKMKQERADREIDLMKAVSRTLHGCKTCAIQGKNT